MSLVVVDIPAKSVEERIGKIVLELGLVIFLLPAKIRVAMERVFLNQRLDRCRDCH